MKKYIIYLFLVVLMFVSFFLSGFYFTESGLIDSKTGDINNERSIQILDELDKLPFISINAYAIVFHVYGKITNIDEESVSILLDVNKEETFMHEEDLSDFREGENVRIYYSYLKNGEKKLIKIQKIP